MLQLTRDQSKTRAFWKDTRFVNIMLALVCVAGFSIFAYYVHQHRDVTITKNEHISTAANQPNRVCHTNQRTGGHSAGLAHTGSTGRDAAMTDNVNAGTEPDVSNDVSNDVPNNTISGVVPNEVSNELPKDVSNEILPAEFETRVANLVSELGKLGVEDKNAWRELCRQAEGLVGALENAFKKNELSKEMLIKQAAVIAVADMRATKKIFQVSNLLPEIGEIESDMNKWHSSSVLECYEDIVDMFGIVEEYK
eukprot:980680_1